jgi:hypothetical protein
LAAGAGCLVLTCGGGIFAGPRSPHQLSWLPPHDLCPAARLCHLHQGRHAPPHG